MKAKKALFYILVLLPLLAVLAALPFLPDRIPAHYGVSGAVDRWGSKYEMLILPGLTILCGCFLLIGMKLAAKQEKSGQNNAKVTLIIGISTLAVFNVITGFILYTSFQQVENLSAMAWDINQILFTVLGISMIVIGNIMPKLRKNAVLGLRTSWSMKNETTWKKSQRFGGISMMAAGAGMVAVCFLTKGIACALWSLAILIAVSVADVYYTYRVAKAE